MSTWFTANELSGLPGMPGSEFRTRDRLKKLGVPSRLREGRLGGGGREFDAAFLPAETRAALLLQQLDRPAAAPVPAAKSATALQAARQDTPPSRQAAACADARAVLLAALGTMAPLVGGVTKATRVMAGQISEGSASAELLAAAEAANARVRKAGVSISPRTLFSWYTAHQAGGWWALLPAETKPNGVARLPDDVAAVLRRYADASGAARNLTHCAQRVNSELGRPFDDWRRLYDQARRALPKVDRVKLIKARHTGAERAAKLPFKRRDTSTIAPNDVWLVDGHTFKAKVRHPDHGAPFAPEVTIAIDAATRKIVGWSVSLSENTIAVGDCIRHAVGQHGVPAMVYSDNGAGERAKVFDCPVAGLFERLGTAHPTGIPGHPQGHGLIERSWQTHMIRCARQFATYQGSDVDDRTLRNVGLALAREQRAVKRAEGAGTVVRLSSQCPSWAQFLDAVAEAVVTYNAVHRHRGLPRHTEGARANKHMTPDEAWEAMLRPDDVVRLDAAQLRHVFMPAVLRTAQRGEVRFLNQHYFSDELMQVDGEQVRVHYDIHDASRVWVWTVSGRFVCEAAWGANRMGYMPEAAVEAARRKRVQGMVKRREQQIETIERELHGTLPAPEPQTFIGDLVMPQRELQMVERLSPADDHAEPQAAAPADGRPFFETASDRYEWLMQHRDRWQQDDRQWAATFAQGDEYASLREYFSSRGIAWLDDADPSAFKSAG